MAIPTIKKIQPYIKTSVPGNPVVPKPLKTAPANTYTQAMASGMAKQTAAPKATATVAKTATTVKAPPKQTLDDVIARAPIAGSNNVKTNGMYRVEVNGRQVDTKDNRPGGTLDQLIKKGGKVVSMPNQQAGFDEAAYLKQQQDGVNSLWDKTKEAQMAQLEANRQKAIGNINGQKAEVAPQYQGMRNQADVVSNQNVQQLRESMAANGLQSSGENVTASVGLSNARQGALNNLNTQEQGIMNDFERQIMQINDPAEQNALIAQLEAQRAQALMDAGNRAGDKAYQVGRDSKEDIWRQGQFDYQKGRDATEDKYRNDQFAFEKARFKSEEDWRKYTYTNMSASEKKNFEVMEKQYGEDRAWQMYELNYNGNLQQSMNQSQIDLYSNGSIPGIP